MKLLVAASWSQDRLEDAQKNFPEVQFTVAANQDDILREIVDAEAVFGNQWGSISGSQTVEVDPKYGCWSRKIGAYS